MIEIHRLDVLVDVGVFHALQCAFDQQLQLIQIAAEFGLQLFVFEQFDAQAQAGDWRAQVMGNRAEQLAALGQVTADAFAHGVERAADFDHFTATALRHRLDIGAQRQIPRCPRQTLERPALPVHQQADEQQQKAAGEDDKPHLLRRQALLFETGVRLRQQRCDVQPLARGHLNLRDQHRRIHRFKRQGVMRPGARQFIKF